MCIQCTCDSVCTVHVHLNKVLIITCNSEVIIQVHACIYSMCKCASARMYCTCEVYTNLSMVYTPTPFCFVFTSKCVWIFTCEL